MYGDERFMSPKKWEYILSKCDGVIIKKFGYYFQNKFLKLVNKIDSSLFINQAPYIAFILKKTKRNHSKFRNIIFIKIKL